MFGWIEGPSNGAWACWVGKTGLGVDPCFGESECEDEYASRFEQVSNASQVISAICGQLFQTRETVLLDIGPEQVVPAAPFIHEIANGVPDAECLVDELDQLSCCVDVPVACGELCVAVGIAAKLREEGVSWLGVEWADSSF